MDSDRLGAIFGPSARLRRLKRWRVFSNGALIPGPLRQTIKKAPGWGFFYGLAEREGFEPSKGYKPLLVFKTSAFNRSATSPVIICSCDGAFCLRNGIDSIVVGHCCPIKTILWVEGWSVGAIFRHISLILDIARWAGSYDSK